MELPNLFKRRLLAGERQIGLWCTIPGGMTAEILAGAGFDWIVFDTEHSPADAITVMESVQAAAPYPVSALARPAANDAALIKRLLDAGVQTIVVPMVGDEAEAEAAARACRYPPHGIRGVSALSRATRWGRVPDYFATADAETCCVVQVETVEALARVEAIAAVPGVDAVFIGPSDLAASMGHLGRPGHPEVVAAVLDAIARLKGLERPVGLLAVDPTLARDAMAAGASFVGVGLDAALLARGAEALAASYRD